jgi:Glycosyl transferase 4-like domain
MKIAYVCFWDAYVQDGVAKKITGQVEQWRAAGHTVEVLCLTPRPAESREPWLTSSTFDFSNLVQRLTATRRLAAAVRAFAPEVVYIRYDLFLPPLWSALDQPTVVMELNESVKEYALRNARARAYSHWSRDQLLRRVDGFVSVASANVEDPVLERLGRPVVVLGNSIDVGAFPVLPAPDNARPRGIFLGGAGLPWHGVDKVRLLAESLPEMDFDIVGPSAADVGGPAPANLSIHGFLPRSEYEPIIARADFAIGTLALHRQDVEGASPLKLREYMAYGLPVVLAHEDPDLTAEPHWFVLELPNTESNVADGINDVRRWVGTVVGRRVPREIAEALVGAEVKEAARLEFMERIAAGR